MLRKYPSKFFPCNPVVMESVCYRTTAKRLLNESNTTGGLTFFLAGYIKLTLAKTCSQENSLSLPRYEYVSPEDAAGVPFLRAQPIFFPDIRSYCSRVPVVLLSFNSRSTLIRLKRRKKIWTGSYVRIRTNAAGGMKKKGICLSV